MSDRDDPTPPERGRTPLGHAVEDKVRLRNCQPGDERSRLGFSRRDTAELPVPDFADEPTPIRERHLIERRVAELELAVVDIHGEKGTNGKLGKVTDKVRLLLWAAGLLVAAAGTGFGAAIHTARANGEEAGRLRQQVERAAADIADLRQSVWDLARGTSQPKGPVP